MLKARDDFISATEIKRGLIAIGFDVDFYRDALPTITTTLTRLIKNGDVVPLYRDGKSLYKWNTSSFKHSPLKYVGQRRTNDEYLAEAIRRRDAGEHITRRMERVLKEAKK